MLNDLFVFIENDLALLTAQSIRDNMPDANIVYLVPYDTAFHVPGIPLVCVDKRDPESIGFELRTAGYKGLCFVVPSGALILKDFRPSLPPEQDLSKFRIAYTQQYMHVGENAHASPYDEMKIDWRAFTDRVCMVNIELLDQPVIERRKIKMPLTMRYGEDPLVLNALNGYMLIEFSNDALRSYIIDFGNKAIDPDATVDECYAYPFDIYELYADKIKGELAATVYDTIKRNAARTKFMSPMRETLIDLLLNKDAREEYGDTKNVCS